MSQRAANGKISDSVRRSQALPLSWDIPTDTQVDKLRARLWKLTVRQERPPKPVEIEGAIWLVLGMQTGEKFRDLYAAFRGSSASSLAPPLLLTCGERRSLIIIRPTADKNPIHLPQTKLLTRLLVMQPPLAEAYDLLFKCPLSDIKNAASDLVRSSTDWQSQPPKAARSLLAHNRWLFRRLREESNGDPALVALLQPDRPAAEQTLTAYCAVPQRTFVKHYRRAIKTLGGVSPMPQNVEFDERLVGRAKVPSNHQLQQDILNIRRRLTRPKMSLDVAEDGKLFDCLPISRNWHLAMMSYTYVLTTFGTGQRGKRIPCSERGIHRESGFAWVVEKGNDKLGLAGARGVFHCRTVREQLARYEDYLDTLYLKLKRRDKSLASDLNELRVDHGHLAFFEVRAGKLAKLTPYGLCKAANAIGWRHDAGMGRRWLRSQLTAALPSDALAAQFGHNLDGLDVWSKHSGLQVRDLPAILGPAIERALSSIGLAPLSPRSPKRRPKLFSAPDTENILLDERDRSGQIIASMIWHGALLRPDQYQAALDAVVSFDPSKETLPWILLNEPKKYTIRWVLDPLTARLVKRYYDAGLPFYPVVNTALQHYFKPPHKKYDEFLNAAKDRWRYKLPPILYAKAIGKSKNHDLPNDQIRSGLSPDPLPPKAKPSFTPSARELIKWLEAIPSKQVKRGRGYKPLLYNQLHTQVVEQPFWTEMPELERWLTLACIQLLVANRGMENTTGYALSTIIERAKRVFGHFANEDIGKYKNLALNKWPRERIPHFLPIGRIRYDVVMDLAALVKAYAFDDEEAEILKVLMQSVENHRSFVVTPDLYSRVLKNEQQLGQRVALNLCYRTGIRLSELTALNKDMLAVHGNTCTLRLDHNSNRRLKTFHSRRIIPLDTLLSRKEYKELSNFLKKQNKWLFPLWKKTDDVLDKAIKREAPDTGVSGFALRHSFATNALAALLWPDNDQLLHAAFFDTDLLSRRNALRARMCGKASLGAIGPHALATVMGHTSPSRTLYSYVHNLEFILAAHVATWQKD